VGTEGRRGEEGMKERREQREWRRGGNGGEEGTEERREQRRERDAVENCREFHCDRRDERTWLLTLNLTADLNNMTRSCMPCRTLHVSIRYCDGRAEQSLICSREYTCQSVSLTYHTLPISTHTLALPCLPPQASPHS
jgi:hypothetical protein